MTKDLAQTRPLALSFEAARLVVVCGCALALIAGGPALPFVSLG